MAGTDPGRMRPRDERAHAYIRLALDAGYLDSGAEYAIDRVTGRDLTHAQANEIRLSVNRGGRHLNVSTPSWVVDSEGKQCYRNCADPLAPHGVRFRLHARVSAREHVVRQAGGDPANLKYNPFARAERAAVDDAGRRI